MKNTKIMAVLVVLLAAMLFVGAASAAAVSDANFEKLASNTTSFTAAATHESPDILIYNTTTWATSSNYDVWIDWGDGAATLEKKPLNPTDVAKGYNVTVNHTYAKPGIYTVTMYNNATVKDATKSKTLATITVVNAKDVKKDGYAFVYEYIYVEDATTLTKYSEGTNPTAVKQIAGTKGLFYLTESVVGGQYGAYYYKGAPSSTSPGEYIYIWYPELTIQAELTDPVTTWGATAGDSIDGKTINKDTNVTFLVNTPMVGPANVNDRFGDLAVKIVFTTPVGGKTTVFGTLNNGAVANYDDVLVTATQNVAGSAIPGIDAVAGTYTAQAEFINYAPFANNAEKSNTISFTVQSTTLVVTAAEDSVIRSNPFTITISGNANAYYNVTIQNPETEGAKNPFFQLGQNGMKNPIQKDAIVIGYQFTTDASGQRTVQFNTNEFTEDKTFTIRVTEAEENAEKTNANWDEVKVKVEKGAVTISASGDGSYYIGSEITLSGTNTDSDTVYLFITGPNLNPNGVKLLDLDKDATNGGSEVAVKTDKTWEKKWNTAGSGLDTGAYTIYATSTDVGKNSLSETEYATVSVSLKQPFLSAVPSGTIVAKGDDLYIRGTAEGEPNELKIYIFGPNKFKDDSVNVEDDGTYEKKIKIDSDWASNQYFVVIQHPMYNGEFDADLNKTDKNAMFFYIKNTDGTTDQASFYVTGKNKLQGSNAADALTKMIDNANIDDIYTKLTFTVTEPRIDITNPGDRAVGSTFTISGTTNLAVDDQIIVEVQSSSFEAVDKTSSSITDGVSVTTKVVAGEGVENTWSVEVDTTNWKLDEYTIKASGIEVDVTATTNFNLVEKVVTPTATATGATPTTTATATATTAPTQTPGFGAFVALAGLGAVALLVLRRN